jgi:hypothetical protein
MRHLIALQALPYSSCTESSDLSLSLVGFMDHAGPQNAAIAIEWHYIILYFGIVTQAGEMIHWTE